MNASSRVSRENEKKISSLKESGIRQMGKGNFERALKDFQKVLDLSPRDPRMMLKVGDCHYKMGENDKAVEYYEKASEIYTKEGFIVKAIAVNKVILRIRPNATHVKERISRLYSEKVGREDVLSSIKKVDDKKEESYPRTALFTELTHDEFMVVVEKMEVIDARADTLIVQEGDPGDSIFIIASGEVSIFREDQDGNEVWITKLGEGDFFGEFGYFSRTHRSASVKTITDSTFLELSREDIESITTKHPGVKEVLFKFYKERILDTLVAVSPMFSTLSKEERSRLLSFFTLKKYEGGEVVVKEGEKGKKMYFIQSGEVEVSTKGDGKKVSLARLGPGDFFGEVSVITKRPRTATITALTDTELAEISQEALKEAIAAHPEIEETLNEYIQLRVEDTITTIMKYKNRRTESGLV